MPTHQDPPTHKPLLSPDEFRAALGNTIGRGAIYELLRAKRVRSVRIGRKYVIPASEVGAFIERETASN